MMPLTALSRTSAVTLAALAGLHLAWAAGSTVPFRDGETLADTVAGTPQVPPTRDSVAVAALLGAAAVLVGDVGPIPHRVRRTGTTGVAAVLAVRGGLGVAGRTAILVPWTPSARFVRLDRRYYGPLCLALAGGALVAGRPAAR